jgi:hypothetical protein
MTRTVAEIRESIEVKDKEIARLSIEKVGPQVRRLKQLKALMLQHIRDTGDAELAQWFNGEVAKSAKSTHRMKKSMSEASKAKAETLKVKNDTKKTLLLIKKEEELTDLALEEVKVYIAFLQEADVLLRDKMTEVGIPIPSDLAQPSGR